MMSGRPNRGFTLVEGIMIFVAIAIIASLGYIFYNAITKQPSIEQTTQQIKQTSQQHIPAVRSTKDLDAATNDLDQIDITTASEVTELEGQQSAL